MKCPNCGADNDPGNRFCEQCGSRLVVEDAPVAVASAPVAATIACPQCGAAVVPGEAFCDECGAALPATTAAPEEAPTLAAAPDWPGESAVPTMGADGSQICPVCGHHNMPGDNFCDNCGAALNANAPAAQASQPQHQNADVSVSSAQNGAPSATIPDMPSTPTQEPPQPSAPIGEPPSEPAPPREEPPQPTTPEQQPPGPAPEPKEAPPAKPAEPQKLETPSTMDMATYEAERKQLEDAIASAQQVITQLEPVQQALGDNTPQGVQDSLAQARAALAQAQTDLSALQPPAPAADPAEIARLEALIAQQEQIIQKLEPVQQALGDNTPQGVQDSLAQARAALAQAQAEHAALTGSAPAAAPAPAAATSGADASAPATDETAQTQEAAPAPAPAVPKAPRLVLEESGTELPLPAGKQEIVIGREDPISGVYPEIDLTAYGGEGGGVSRQHARLVQTDGQWTIIDLNSTNYTRVDGTKIEPNTPVPIHDGSRVQLGRVAMVFQTQ